MKRLCLSAALIAASFFYAHSQELVQDEIDQFENVRIQKTSRHLLGHPVDDFLDADICLIRVSSGKSSLTSIALYVSYVNSFSFGKGDLLTLLFEDGSKINLASMDNAVAEKQDELWWASTSYALTFIEIQKLKAAKVKAVRITARSYGRRFNLDVVEVAIENREIIGRLISVFK